MSEIKIWEYGKIIQGDQTSENPELDSCYVSQQAWDYLEKFAYSNDKEHRFIRQASHSGEKAYQVVNFVGVIATSDGTHIEILPKTSEDGQNVGETRKLLLKMLSAVHDLNYLETKEANLELSNKPLIDLLIARFLKQLADVVHKGIRKDYQRIEAEERFLKGRLQVGRQIRQPVGRQHLFHIEYDVFSEDRAENRLIHSALVQVAKWGKSEANQKLARELRFAFNDVPLSTNYKTDFSLWRNSREMINYRALLPWIRLILNQQSPFTIKGLHAGISFLFPMEELFEKYVAKKLEQAVFTHGNGYSIKTQIKSEYLSNHPRNAFLLKPDLAIYKNQKLIGILDTKWKLIDQNTQYTNGDADPKSGISQADVYQLFAYGHKYLNGNGTLMLIYPKWKKFEKPKEFKLGDSLTLVAFPFDLEKQNSSKDILDKFVVSGT